MGVELRMKTVGVAILVWAVLAGPAAAAERMAVKAAIANLRSGPSTKGEVLWQVEKFHPFVIVKKQKNWYKVKDFEGDTAWIHDSLLGKISAVITVKDKCNVRSGPDTKHNVLFTVERGVPFKVLKQKGNWIRIEHADGDTGWIYKTLVW